MQEHECCQALLTNSYVPPNEGERGHIAFGADPVGVAHCLHSCLLNQWVDFVHIHIIGREEKLY